MATKTKAQAPTAPTFMDPALMPWVLVSEVYWMSYKLLERRLYELGVSVTWHTLRHTAATQWLRYGADVFSVSRRLGHASTAFTMDVYGHLLHGQQQRAAEALAHVLG